MIRSRRLPVDVAFIQTSPPDAFGFVNLGVWSEMFSDGVIDLIENGNVTGKYKAIHPNKVSASFTFGSNHLYEFVDRNPTFTLHPADFINDPVRSAQ